jgi:hypothetical protein
VNTVLQDIIKSKTVTDGTEVFPLRANMDVGEGAMISKAWKAAKAATTLEIGLAYGVSALFACDALAEIGRTPRRHIVIDPSQLDVWHNIGLRNLREAGHADFVEHIAKGSELALPELLAGGLKVDAAIVDGYHTFDHALVDCFYVTRMLRVGGIMVLDDTQPQWPALNRLIRYFAAYPCYRIFDIANVPKASRMEADLLIGADPQTIDWANVSAGALGTAVALQKVAEDRRRWDWWTSF